MWSNLLIRLIKSHFIVESIEWYIIHLLNVIFSNLIGSISIATFYLVAIIDYQLLFAIEIHIIELKWSVIVQWRILVFIWILIGYIIQIINITILIALESL